MELIQQALELAPALKILVIKAEHNKPRHGVQLKHFQLSAEEWMLLVELSLLLDVSFFGCIVITLISIQQGLPFSNERNLEEQDAFGTSSDSHF